MKVNDDETGKINFAFYFKIKLLKSQLIKFICFTGKKYEQKNN